MHLPSFGASGSGAVKSTTSQVRSARSDPNAPMRCRGARRARALSMRSPFANRGRGECRVPNAPAALRALGVGSQHASIHSGGTG